MISSAVFEAKSHFFKDTLECRATARFGNYNPPISSLGFAWGLRFGPTKSRGQSPIRFLGALFAQSPVFCGISWKLDSEVMGFGAFFSEDLQNAGQ